MAHTDNILVIPASAQQSQLVSDLVTCLLIELEPGATAEIEAMNLPDITAKLFTAEKIWAFLAMDDGKAIGIITLHECAAIYAGGVFGEISELYVAPEYRSANVGRLLLDAAIEKGKELNWQRLEVGSPPPAESPRTIQFYERQGFKATGSRLRLLIETAT